MFTTFYFRFRHWAFWTKLIATTRLKTFQYRLVWACIHKKLIACHSPNFNICVGSRIILPVTLLQPTKTDDRSLIIRNAKTFVNVDVSNGDVIKRSSKLTSFSYKLVYTLAYHIYSGLYENDVSYLMQASVFRKIFHAMKAALSQWKWFIYSLANNEHYQLYITISCIYWANLNKYL